MFCCGIELDVVFFTYHFCFFGFNFGALGRDGFTHNMLDNIHALWKRRRVCKIKCKGVCTVDMDNVCQQLEVGFDEFESLIIHLSFTISVIP